MKREKFNIFDEHGYLPKGIHKMTLEEVEETFSKNKSLKRQEIMEEYKKHLKDLRDTGYYVDHWIDGSFVTSKENPKDIDTLTEFDATKIIENNDKEKIDNLIKEAHLKSNKLCHSFKVYRYPRRIMRITKDTSTTNEESSLFCLEAIKKIFQKELFI